MDIFFVLLIATLLAPFKCDQCEPIRIDMCRNIGYNETSMPNLLGMELQTDVDFTLQTFAPLIEFVCSTQLKLFLCAAYVPMCTSKVSQPIGPCRNLCESVRSRCHPVLQGFGFPWPPALDCARFPKENNHETMCMEGPGETHLLDPEHSVVPMQGTTIECPGIAKAHLFVKIHRLQRCAMLCEADVLFGQHEKHLSEIWVSTWAYVTLAVGFLTTICIIFADDSKTSSKWSLMLTPLIWCHLLVSIGWSVRFIFGRRATACGFDPQFPNDSLLLVDGLSNASCAATFLLRYYFGMASCVWWAILCLGWHRVVRQNNPEVLGHIAMETTLPATNRSTKPQQTVANITHSNFARFAAWGLPAFQTAAVIVARWVDADELLGACFVGNQSDKGLQIFVATPFFCYWIFGSMNLISGYLVHRRSKEIRSLQSPKHQFPVNSKENQSGIGTFLFIYCVPFALLLLAVIYEFANIDVWLNVPPYVTAMEGITTPLWPFLTRAFMELMLGIICFAWVLGPKILTIYKRQVTPREYKHKAQPTPQSSRASNVAYSSVSYQTVRQTPTCNNKEVSATISMNQFSNCSLSRSYKHQSLSSSTRIHHSRYKQAQAHVQAQQFHRYEDSKTLKQNFEQKPTRRPKTVPEIYNSNFMPGRN